MHFNCKKESILEVLNSPIPSNKAEASFAQNLLDNLGMPHELPIGLMDAKEFIVSDNNWEKLGTGLTADAIE
jgi:hypothetical protein